MRVVVPGIEVKKVESCHPHPRQAQASRVRATFVLYGGAMRGGKTCWLCNSAIQLSHVFPGNRGFLCRHEYSEFKKTTYEELSKWLHPALVASHNHTDHVITFRNGSKIFYGGLGDDEKAIERIKSMELGWFGIDQVEETTEDHFYMLVSRLSLPLDGIIYKGLCTANPKDNWVKTRWLDQDLEDHAFIPALPGDNPSNPQSYIEMMRKILPPDLFDAWIQGDWTILSDENALFPAEEVKDAMYRKLDQASDIRVSSIGVDVAREGDDETIFTYKRSFKYSMRAFQRLQDIMIIKDKLYEECTIHQYADIKIDTIGYGAGVYDALKREIPELREKYNWKGSLFEYKGTHGARNRRFKNRRAEDHWQLKEDLRWISLPLDEVLRKQMTLRYRILSSDGLCRIESKEEFKKRIKMSPDRLDSLVICHTSMRELRKGKVLRRGASKRDK